MPLQRRSLRAAALKAEPALDQRRQLGKRSFLGPPLPPSPALWGAVEKTELRSAPREPGTRQTPSPRGSRSRCQAGSRAQQTTRRGQVSAAPSPREAPREGPARGSPQPPAPPRGAPAAGPPPSPLPPRLSPAPRPLSPCGSGCSSACCCCRTRCRTVSRRHPSRPPRLPRSLPRAPPAASPATCPAGRPPPAAMRDPAAGRRPFRGAPTASRNGAASSRAEIWGACRGASSETPAAPLLPRCFSQLSGPCACPEEA